MSSLNDPEELARGTKPNTLTVIRTSDYNGWVHPDAPEDYVGSYENRSPRRDYVLTGIVVVHLAKRRRAKKLVVKFVCEARLAFPNQILEDDVIFEKALEIGDGVEGLLLDAGPQRFEFSFVVPSTIAGFDRTSYGRVTHRVDAMLVGQPTKRFGNFFGSNSSTPSASRSPSPRPSFTRSTSHERMRSTGPPTGMGMGVYALGDKSPSSRSPMVSPIISPNLSTADLTSIADPLLIHTEDIKWLQGNMKAHKDLWILPIPSDKPDAISLDYSSNNAIAGLGVLRWSLQSDAIAVGSYVKLRCALLDELPKGAVIEAVRLYILQTFSIKSPRRPEEEETVFPAISMLVLEKGKISPGREREKGWRPLWSSNGDGYMSGLTWMIEELARLPDEKRLRPSTCPGTITPIRVKNEFSLHLFFSVENEDAFGNPLPQPGPGQLRRAELITTVLIPSCACIKVNFQIPTYEESMTEQRLTYLDGGKNDINFEKCACGEPLNKLAERELERGGAGEEGMIEEDDFRGRDPARRGPRKAEYESLSRSRLREP